MRNCANCNKELSKSTKGNLCQHCYRNRNNIIDINNKDDAININISHSSTNDSIDNKMDNSIPLSDVIDLNERAIINVIKQNMMMVKSRDYELIEILKSQVEFLKYEIKNKNELIDKLMSELAENKDDAWLLKSQYKSRDHNESNSFSSTEDLNDSLSDISSNPLNDSPMDNFDYQFANYRYKKHNEYLASKNNTESLINNQTVIPNEYTTVDNKQFAMWEKHSKGFGSKMLTKMGYDGKGLGKDGDGIIHPVTITKKNKFNNDGEEAVNTNQEHVTTSFEKIRRVINNVHLWPNGTTLITGSSILLGVEESRLKKYNVKIRPFPGATVDDMFDYLIPLLKKEPSYIILQIGSNDSPSKTCDEILDEILNLKAFIHSALPNARVFISCPVIRTDNKKANNTLRELDIILKNTTKDIVINDNIDITCLGKRGLHLNPKGSGRLAINFISLMRRL